MRIFTLLSLLAVALLGALASGCQQASEVPPEAKLPDAATVQQQSTAKPQTLTDNPARPKQ